MDLEKDFQPLSSQTFWAWPKSEFVEHLVTEASNNVWKHNEFMVDFWKQVDKFVSNASNLLFTQVPTLQADTEKQW